MSLWAWYRARRWGWKIAIGVPAVIVAAAALYVVGRTLQFAAAEKEAGLYVPSTANVVLRASDLESHLPRLQATAAWRMLRRRVLRDPAVRPAINRLLKGEGLPTLDELEDERNSDVYSMDLLLRGAGRDAAAALQVGDSWSALRGCAITRLRWSDYLLAPFAHLVLPKESLGGRTVFRLRMGKTELLIAFEGRLALVSNDRALLEQALRRKGTESPADRPFTARVAFGSSPPLLEIRRMLRDSGTLPQIRMDSVLALEASVDLTGPAAVVDLSFEGAEPTRADSAAPHAWARLAPENTTGNLMSATGVKDLFDWLRSLAASLGPKDPLGQNIREGLEAMDEVGFTSDFLPKMGGGVAILTGAEERENVVYPALAFVIPSQDPTGAVEVLGRIIKIRGGRMAEARLEPPIYVGDVAIHSWRWPDGMQVNDYLRPCWAAFPGAFVFGNNLRFTEALLRRVEEEGGGAYVPVKKLRQYGIASDPGLAGGYLLLPPLRESLDGPIPRLAQYLVEAAKPDAVFRRELDAELRQEGRVLPESEVRQIFHERRKNQVRDREDELRESLHVLDFMKWAAFSMEAASKGIRMRAVLEFR